MGRNFSSGLLGGVVAAVIWMAIALWQGMAIETVGLWALIILVVTTIIATVISALIGRGTEAAARV